MTAWPYDARKDDPLTAHRIAVVSHPYPEWSYIVSLDMGDWAGEPAMRPNEHEVALLRSYLAFYIHRWYRPGYVARMRERPFDIDGSANGVTFRKYAQDDWAYSKRSWTSGPPYLPVPPNLRTSSGLQRHSLAELLEHINAPDRKPPQDWAEWKRDHPEVFGVVAR